MQRCASPPESCRRPSPPGVEKHHALARPPDTGIESFQEAGYTPSEILRFMTTGAAKLLGLDGQRGGIRPGMAAEIVAVPGVPLADASVLRRVSFVMKDGKIIKR